MNGATCLIKSELAQLFIAHFIINSALISVMHIDPERFKESAMIDWERVQALRSDIGDDGFNEVIELFLEEMGGRISEIQVNGFNEKAADIHFLKGCAANIGFSSLVGICLNAEEGADISPDQIVECYAASITSFIGGTNDSAC